MNNKIKMLLFCLATASSLYAQIINAPLLHPFFEKLIALETKKNGKVSIVHIGDSHIQPDYLTNAVRQPLQQKFGDGGRGFIFPYTLNKQVATRPYYFASNATWQICRNNQPFKCESGTEFGLSGYGFSTKAEQFVFLVEAREGIHNFNTIKIVSATASLYRLATVDGNKKPITYSEKPSVNTHVVKRGETLDIIAKNYNVSAAAIKEENKMKSNSVHAGKKLRIPITLIETSVDTSMFRPLEYQLQEPFVSMYHQEKPISAIYFFPTKKQNLYSLNGLIVEKDTPGLIYHNIGTVGSMASNFNANPLFFEQFPILKPDLVIISLGTNESFNAVTTEKYIENMELFINNIRKFCPDVPVLITTPPISLLPGRKFNTYILEYTHALFKKDNIALWDLYSFLSGLMGPEKNLAAIKITGDKVHYTMEGYIDQGTAFANDFLNEYEHYKQNRK